MKIIMKTMKIKLLMIKMKEVRVKIARSHLLKPKMKTKKIIQMMKNMKSKRK